VKAPLLKVDDRGLWCEAGGFYIDPWKSVSRAIITHAHSDHAKPGSSQYLCTTRGKGVLQCRLGASAKIESLPYGESLSIGGVKVSFHPAGHILGSAQVRVEYKGEVWVVTGDYKREPDRTCDPFEIVKCHTLITESTFGMPIFRWPLAHEVAEDIKTWWNQNTQQNLHSILLGYSLGKSQRLLSYLESGPAPIYLHPSVIPLTKAYEKEGIEFPKYAPIPKNPLPGSLVIAPPAFLQSTDFHPFANSTLAYASGWMAVKNLRKRQPADRSFIVSDHCDWPSLLLTIKECDAEQILVTHGYTATFVKYLRSIGYYADELHTAYLGETNPISSETAKLEFNL